jgi:prolyl oligopeptidase
MTAPPVAAPASTLPPLLVKKPAYPASPRRAVVDLYGHERVNDDYRWLEDGESPEVKAWSEAESAFGRRWLDAIPQRKALRDRIEQLMNDPSPSWENVQARKGMVFALESRPPKQHPYLVVMPSIDAAKDARVVVDPDAIDPTGGTAIDFYVPSLDGKHVAVSLSSGGSELGDVHVFDVTTGKDREVVPRVNTGTAGGSLAWKGDGSGFFYTRYPRPGERPAEDLVFYQQVWFHKLGGARDTYALGHDAPKIAEWSLRTSTDGRTVIARMAYGDGGEFETWVLPHTGTWEPLAMRRDRVKEAVAGSDGMLYLLSFAGAPKGKVLRTSASMPEIGRAETVVPEGDAALTKIVPTASRLYLLESAGGVARVRSLSVAKGARGAPQVLAIPPVSGVEELEALTGDDAALRVESYTDPPSWYRVSAKDGSVVKTSLAETPTADFSGVEAVRETCTSKDGTSIPITIVRPKNLKLEGATPTLLSGYGGYGIPMNPKYAAYRLAWLEQGAVFAMANLRGGGELGEDWHHAGNLTKKQNVFDDFYGCAQHLETAKYTSRDHLAILGGSNGGLLMGAEITQHPEAFKAVVAQVGLFDMLRVERDANGTFNVTEFGTVTDPQQFEALRAYSPFHHVVDGTAYPAALFLTGAHDLRVNPYHSRKMVARLQGATSSDAPILLRTSANTGHGIGSPLGARIEEKTDIFAFLFQQLGMAGGPVK